MKMTTLADLFDQEEIAMLSRAKAEIAAEALRYETDPAYRAAVDAKRKEAEDFLEATADSAEDEDEDEDEGE
jgi:hypothetical protein